MVSMRERTPRVPVGVAGNGAHLVMLGGDVRSADIGDPALAEPGKDALPDDFAVEPGGAGLEMVGSVIVHETLGEVCHGGFAGLSRHLALEVAPDPEGAGRRREGGSDLAGGANAPSARSAQACWAARRIRGRGSRIGQ